MNGRDAGDGFFGEDAEFQRQSAREFTVQIDGAAAHSGDHSGVFDLWPLQLHENDGLFGAEKIVQNADDFQIELLDLIARKNRVGVPLHARANLAERKEFVRLLRDGGSGSRA